MIVDLHKLDDSAGHLSGDHDVRFVDTFGLDAVVPCAIEADYRHVGGAWYFDVHVRGEYATPCHRCLDEVRQPVEGEFELVVRRSGSSDSAGETEEGYLVLPLGAHEVSLGPFIHESFVVSIPMVIQCGEDCRGLCPKCGANLNRDTCGCVAESTDERWDGLRRVQPRKRGQ